MTDEEMIKAFIKAKGVTKCAPAKKADASKGDRWARDAAREAVAYGRCTPEEASRRYGVSLNLCKAEEKKELDRRGYYD